MTPEESLLDILRADTANTGEFVDEAFILARFAGGWNKYRERTAKQRRAIRTTVYTALNRLIVGGLIERAGHKRFGCRYRVRSLLDRIAEAASGV